MEDFDVNNADFCQAQIDNWLASANNAEGKFCLVLWAALTQAKDHGNWNSLSKLYAVMNGKKGKRIRRVETDRLPYAAPAKRALAHALMHIKPVFDDSLDFGVKWIKSKDHNPGFNDTAIAKLFTLAQEGYGPNSKTFKNEFPSLVEKKQKEQAELVKAKAASLAKWCEENNIPASVLFHAMGAKDTNAGEEPNF